MAKASEIKRIDLLVHPFFSIGAHAIEPFDYDFKIYTDKEAKELLELWKKHVDEVVKDPNRLLFVSPASSDPKAKEILKYAKQQLGDRFAIFIASAGSFKDAKGKKFEKFEKFTVAKGFKVNADTVKTRSLGEYTNSCVGKYLTVLNKEIGLKNPIPYRNRQSTVIPRKSVGKYSLWAIRKPKRTIEGKIATREKARNHANARFKSANTLAEKYLSSKNNFKPRTHLKRKRV